jgi:hypothetical protein
MTANVQILWGERRGLVRRMAGDPVSGEEMHDIEQVHFQIGAQLFQWRRHACKSARIGF